MLTTVTCKVIVRLKGNDDQVLYRVQKLAWFAQKDLSLTMLGVEVHDLDWVCSCLNSRHSIYSGKGNLFLLLFSLLLVSSEAVEPCRQCYLHSLLEPRTWL